MRFAAALLVLLACATARAQEAEPEPAWHGYVAAGGALPLGGPTPGAWVGAGFSGNTWGVRLDGFLFDPASDARPGLAAGALTYELGRTRRHLVVTLHFGGGMRFPELAPVGIAGLQAQLGLMRDGPLVLGADTALHVDMGQLPLDVYLVETLSVGLIW